MTYTLTQKFACKEHKECTCSNKRLWLMHYTLNIEGENED